MLFRIDHQLTIKVIGEMWIRLFFTFTPTQYLHARVVPFLYQNTMSSIHSWGKVEKVPFGPIPLSLHHIATHEINRSTSSRTASLSISLCLPIFYGHIAISAKSRVT